MKNFKIFFIFSFLSFFGNMYGQSEADKNLIAKIEKQILNKNIKKETFQEGDSTTTIYFKNNTPILIEKQTGKFRHTYSFIGNKRTERDYTSFINAKFYIQNWKKNTYIRVGEIIEIQPANSNEMMPIDYVYNYNKVKIEDLIKKLNALKQESN